MGESASADADRSGIGSSRCRRIASRPPLVVGSRLGVRKGSIENEDICPARPRQQDFSGIVVRVHPPRRERTYRDAGPKRGRAIVDGGDGTGRITPTAKWENV